RKTEHKPHSPSAAPGEFRDQDRARHEQPAHRWKQRIQDARKPGTGGPLHRISPHDLRYAPWDIGSSVLWISRPKLRERAEKARGRFIPIDRFMFETHLLFYFSGHLRVFHIVGNSPGPPKGILRMEQQNQVSADFRSGSYVAADASLLEA